MKNIFVIVIIIVMVYTSGCAQETQEEKSHPVMTDISLDPLLLPTKKQPEITEEKEGVRFLWPDQEWFLIEDEAGLYAVSMDLTYRLDLQPKRRQIQAIPLSRQKEEALLESYVIHEVIPVKEGFLLETEDNNGLFGLAHLRRITDEEVEWLVRDAGEQPEHIISQDKSKVVFWKFPEEHLSAYHTVTGRNTSFPSLTKDQFCEDWVQHINLSPLGGYLAYEMIDCPTGYPIQFTILGADSGRLIRDLPGKNPGWDHLDRQIVFQLAAAPQQLGMYSLQTDDIVFFNRIANEFSLYRSPLYSEDNAYLIYAVKNEQESRLIIHHTGQGLLQSMLLPEGTMVAETGQWAFMNERILIAAIHGDAGYHLFIHHIVSELTEIIGPIDHWNEDGSIRWFDSDLDAYTYYVKDGSVMQAQDGSHHPLLKIPQDTYLTGIDTWQGWPLITVENSRGENQLYFIGL